MQEDKDNQNIVRTSIDEVLHNSMIPYAEHVILDRALPRVEDGLKPVQRRIMYTMFEMGLTPDKPHKKCAKIVGDCLGKYHPHGDSSVYDALVRMAQNFNMREMLVDGHGNFGTVDGDSAAAYRYTEARLQPLALELLRDIDKQTVNFSLNFDDTLKEPDTLPGRYPNLLVNGASGIAVGLATNIPPHNLGEVIDGVCAYIDDPKIPLERMMKFIKGPDFPTGGIIVSNEELFQAYETGRGKIRVRAKVSVEKSGDKQNIIISELPYQVNKAVLLKKIADLKEEKKDDLDGIADVVDESDRNGMRAVIKLKKDENPQRILSVLYKYSDLENTFGINMVAIADGKPCQLGLLPIIAYYVNYQRGVILRRSKFDLERAKERAHILEGLIIAVKNIDEVIRIIRKSANTTDAKKNLRDRFVLSEAQATAILDMRLARLTKLEIDKLLDELKELKILIKELTAVIGSKTLQTEVVKTELLQIKRRYKDDRRTTICADGAPTAVEEYFEKEKIKENFILAFTANNTLKKIPEKNFRLSDKDITARTVKNDLIKFSVKICSDETVLAFTNLGNVCKIDAEILPECKYKDKGMKFSEAFKYALPNETPVAFFSDAPAENAKDLLFFTRNGMVKRTERKEYSLIKPYYQAIKLKEGDSLAAVEEDKENTTVAYITRKGLCFNMNKNDLPRQGRVAGGVAGIKLKKGDETLFVSQIEDCGEFIVFTSMGTVKRVLVTDFDVNNRNGGGKKICELPSEKDAAVFGGYVQEPYSLAYFDDNSYPYKIFSEDIPIDDRVNKGKPLKDGGVKKIPVSVFVLRD